VSKKKHPKYETPTGWDLCFFPERYEKNGEGCGRERIVVSLSPMQKRDGSYFDACYKQGEVAAGIHFANPCGQKRTLAEGSSSVGQSGLVK